jgi:membrane fusion protein, heavy metal efflux system
MSANVSRRAPIVLVWFGRVVPNLLVLAGLAGFAWWGYETGWKLPKFAEMTGATPEKEAKWCDEHNVQESLCVECNLTRFPRPKSFGWCAEHGVMDCPLHHPEVAQLPYPPIVAPANFERARRGLEFTDRAENNPDSKMYLRRVQFASDDALEKAGVDVRPVRRERVVESVPANGEVGYDQTLVARLSCRVPGSVWRMEKQAGDPVRRGEVVALVDAAEVGKAKTEFLQALAEGTVRTKTFDSMTEGVKSGSIPQAQYRMAEAALGEARIRLTSARQALVNLGLPVRSEEFQGLPAEEISRRVQFLGLPEAVVKTFDARTVTANLLPVTSPLDGVVVERGATAGEVVDSSKALFVVADVRRMWITLDLRVEDARLVSPGRTVRFRPDGYPGKEDLTGTIAWVSTAVDEKTRTVKARVELPNPKGDLRAGAFGSARVVLREEKDAVVVPAEAVHQLDGCTVVFVRDKDFLKERAPKLFYVREVRPGAKSEDGRLTEIVVGLLPGEVVATRGSDLLRAQLMKDQLGGDDD